MINPDSSNGKIPQKPHFHWLWLYVFAIICIAFIVNLCMFIPIPTPSGLNNGYWLGFWGSLLGGSIGCIPAIAALRENRLESERQFEKEQRNRRLGVIPIFDCQILDRPYTFYNSHSIQNGFVIDYLGTLRNRNECDDQEPYESEMMNFLKLSNCGLGPALNVKLSFDNSSVDLSYIRNGNDPYFYWIVLSRGFFKDEDTMSHISLVLSFSDVYGNRYKQTFVFRCLYSFEGENEYMQFSAEKIGQPVPIENNTSEE